MTFLRFDPLDDSDRRHSTFRTKSRHYQRISVTVKTDITVVITEAENRISGGGVRIRTGVRGFAGPCLTTRPRRQN